MHEAQGFDLFLDEDSRDTAYDSLLWHLKEGNRCVRAFCPASAPKTHPFTHSHTHPHTPASTGCARPIFTFFLTVWTTCTQKDFTFHKMGGTACTTGKGERTYKSELRVRVLVLSLVSSSNERPPPPLPPSACAQFASVLVIRILHFLSVNVVLVYCKAPRHNFPGGTTAQLKRVGGWWAPSQCRHAAVALASHVPVRVTLQVSRTHVLVESTTCNRTLLH